ncbi:MAG: putative Hybrid sensor histidine kinase [Gemmatimonadetes bacterium]|nr:putative Hybrid sensor histidine kinase [Gemmatimonadota bacterium]
MSRNPIRSIRAKLMVAFAALVAAIAVFVFVFFPARLERQALAATVAKANVIRDMTAYSLGAGLLFNDEAAVSEVVAGVAAVRDVAFLIVWNDSGRVVAQRGSIMPPAGRAPERPASEISSDGRTYLIATPVLNGTVRVGALSAGISLDPLNAEVARSRHVGAVIGLLIFAIGLVAIYAISTLVTRPLTAVALTVNRIAEGDLTLRATETSDDEVANLVRAFNHMVDTLVGTQAELAVINAELETRVTARTAELTSAIGDLRRSQIALSEGEAAARRTSALMQSLIDVAPHAIVATDVNWLVTKWNPEAERLFGWTQAEVLDNPLPYIPPEEQESFEAQKLVAATHGTGDAVEVTRMRKDGSRFSALLGVSVLRDHEGQPSGYLGFFTDLTERKKLEEQLRQSQKMEAMGRLAGGVAHDFNNVLTIIMACSELMLLQERSADDRSQLEHIAGAAARAAALTRQLLTFTRQEVVQLRVIDVGAVVGDLEPMLRRVLPSNIEMVSRLDRGNGYVMADPTQIEQIVMNLVVNAADAMTRGGQLRVELKHMTAGRAPIEGGPLPPGRYTSLRIEDTGTGIDEETLGKIFEPFFTTKEVGKGTGLGLATVYGIVAVLGGVIRVTSTVGQGTTFMIYLPETSDSSASSHLSTDEPMIAGAKRGKILLVEDESSVRRVVRRSLEHAGYVVVEAVTGEAALGLAAVLGGELTAVVTDMMMPGMTGRAFAEILRARLPHLGVVFMSGYSDAIIDPAAIGEGRYVFLQKPFTSAQIVAAIATVALA